MIATLFVLHFMHHSHCLIDASLPCCCKLDSYLLQQDFSVNLKGLLQFGQIQNPDYYTGM